MERMEEIAPPPTPSTLSIQPFIYSILIGSSVRQAGKIANFAKASKGFEDGAKRFEIGLF